MTSSWEDIRSRIGHLKDVAENIILQAPDLPTKVRRQEQELEEKHEEIRRLHAKMDELDVELQSERRARTEVEQTLQDVQRGRGCRASEEDADLRFEEEKERYEVQLQESRRMKEQLLDRVKDLELEIKDLKKSSMKSTLAQELGKVQADYEDAQTVLQQKDAELEATKAANRELQATVATWRRNAPDQVVELHGQIEELTAANAELAAKSATYLQIATDAKTVVESLLAEYSDGVVEKVKENLAAANEALQRTKALLVQREKEVAELQANLDVCSANVKRKDETISMSNGKIKSLEEDNGRKDETQKALQARVETLTAGNGVLETQLDKANNTNRVLQQKLEDLQGSLVKQETKTRVLEQDLRKAKYMLEITEQNLAEVTRSLKVADDENLLLVNINNKERKARGESETKLAKALHDLETCKGEAGDASIKLLKMSELQRQLDRLRSANARLEAKLNENAQGK